MPNSPATVQRRNALSINQRYEGSVVSDSVRNSRRSWNVVAAAAVLLAACGEGTTEPKATSEVPAAETRDVPPPVITNTRESSPLSSLTSCGAPVVYKLTDLRNTIGTVTITNDASKLYVTYAITTKDWFISDTRLAIAKTYAKIPQDNRRLPLPWSFPHFADHEPVVTSATHAFKISDLGTAAGENIVIAAMAGVVHPKTSSYEGPWEWLVMWGIGNLSGQSVETIYNYTIAKCSGAPPAPPLSSGGIFTITFDDGWLNTYTTAYPVLKELGLKGNIAVNPDPIDGGWTGYMTLAQLKELKNAGWSIVSHSLSHRDLVTLTQAELHRELRDSKAWIERNGFGPSDVFIVPFHSWGSRERTAIEQYYSRARGYTVNQFVPAMFSDYPITKPYDLTGYEPEFAPFTTPEGRAQTMEYVKRAVEESEFVDLFFHQITPSQLPAFRQLMTEIAQVARYKAAIKTWGEFSVAPKP
jgi:peptidoglycan/xylan/chitin deacetylase (PgdA/CDA1 family)